jgi:hypothetical protein
MRMESNHLSHTERNRLKAQKIKDETDYMRHDGRDGGFIEIPLSASQNRHEARQNYNAYLLLANRGRQYKLLPVVNLPDVQNPDAQNLQTKYYSDAKHPTTNNGKNAVKNSIRSAYSEGVKEIVIRFCKEYNHRDLQRGLYESFSNQRYAKVEWVIFIYANNEVDIINIIELKQELKNTEGRSNE